jgi:tRNA threonylcarbamoyladenosine biosynthesis protein TsaB
MKTLVIDTSSEKGVLALLQGTELLGLTPLPEGAALSKVLSTEVKKLLDLHPGKWDRIVLGAGPGSYTGIRVGASIAQALSYGWDIPLYTASSLSAYLPPEEPSWGVLVDARSGGFYFQSTEMSLPKRISLQEAETLSSFKILVSPHPDRIKERAAHLHCTLMNPSYTLLTLYSRPAPSPLSLLYCA